MLLNFAQRVAFRIALSFERHQNCHIRLKTNAKLCESPIFNIELIEYHSIKHGGGGA